MLNKNCSLLKVLVCTVVLLSRSVHTATVVYNSSYVGFWEGDFWIPPDGQIFDMRQMFDILKDRQLLVYGDSLGRRMCSTLAFLLQKYQDNIVDDISAADIDADAATSLQTVGHGSHTYEVQTKGLRYEWSPLLANVESKSCSVENPIDPAVSDVVVDIGIHDAERSIEGRDKEYRYQQYVNGTQNALTCLTRDPQRRVFWRTAPYAYFGGSDSERNHTSRVDSETHMFNHAAKTVCARFTQCVIVDAELLLRHKSVGADRLAGDSPEHFGSVARLAMIQLLLRAMHYSNSPLPVVTQLRRKVSGSKPSSTVHI